MDQLSGQVLRKNIHRVGRQEAECAEEYQNREHWGCFCHGHASMKEVFMSQEGVINNIDIDKADNLLLT